MDGLFKIKIPKKNWIDENIWLGNKAYSIKCESDNKRNI